MKQFQAFIFESYSFDPESKVLNLNYSFDQKVKFTETFKFDFPFNPEVDQEVLEVALQTLFYMAGVSYYKAFLPPKILVNTKPFIDQQTAGLFNKTYQKGLGEFFYVNKLDPHTPVSFPVNSPQKSPLVRDNYNGLLVAIGGGKDSLVSVELLRNQPKIATWCVGHKTQLQPLVEKIGLPHFWVERQWDRTLLDQNAQGAYNGHIPISAIFASVGLVVAALSGYRDIVVSNESTASEPTLHYQGVAINHQYSKSLEFEKEFQEYLKSRLADSIRYYSLLRPFTEVRIAELFAKLGFQKYKEVFSSCNRAFVHTSNHLFWCGHCPKCAFVFLALTSFVSREELESLFSGQNLLLVPNLEPTYKQLLGIEGDKPLDCVGGVKETRSAMRLAQKIYPQLKKYEFELPENYDFRALSPHLVPKDISKILFSALKS